MARDYANRKKAPARRSAQTKSTQPGMPGWVWLMVGVTAGLVIAVVLYIINGPEPAPRQPQTPPAEQQVKTPEPAKQLPPKEEARFTFYEMLPNFQLVPRTEQYTPPPEPATNLSYAIQAGSFGRESDAEARRAEIALLGMQSRVETAKLDDGRTVYRVIIGPETSFKRVKNQMARLYDNGIESFFRRIDS